MTRLLDGIRTDHRNFVRLLKLLERETGHLADGTFTNLPLMTDLMQYFVNYPDIHHHPIEDRIFAMLRERDPNVADTIDEIHAEHTSMGEASERIRDQVVAIGGAGVVSRERLVDELREFIELYRSHMNREEAELLGVAEAQLDTAAWRSIEKDFAGSVDPVFGESVDGHYAALYQAILAEAGSEQAKPG